MYHVPSLLVAALLQVAGPGIAVLPEAAEVEVGDTTALSVPGVEAESVQWFSTDEDVATVDAQGRVVAVRPGSARIGARVDGATAFAEITVPELPAAEITVVAPTDVIYEGQGIPLTVTGRTRLGDVVADPQVEITSDRPDVARVEPDGRVVALQGGMVNIRIAGRSAESRLRLAIRRDPGLTYTLRPELPEVRTGDVVRFSVTARAPEGSMATFPAWSVGGSGASIEAEGRHGVFVAEEPGRYRVSAEVGPGTVLNTFVEVAPRGYGASLDAVGRGAIETHHSGDMWVFEGVDGRDYVYVGTFMHDWMKVWDVTDPTRPVLTDSLQLDARRINDVKIHPDNRLAVVTREGASDRRNGIVILDLARPAHPRILSEYKETMTGGVHNVWILGDEDLVYACHNGTSEMHIIDISDPANPREIGRWGLEKRQKTLHDVIVQDGYAYLSYWDDGIITLDVGAGTHGGTARAPAFVSQFKYSIGSTHVAWRAGRYLFVGDELFPVGWDADKPIQARGYVHVVDYADIENPREVGRFEVPEAGAHNLWAEGDRLYIGYYQAGLRVVDISGELRGDLYAQGRQVAAIATRDEHMVTPNWPMTWGAQLHKGYIFSSDMNSGIWVTKLTERPGVVF
ncbi:MAG: Ig-like domain-containing protein [Gemmatimonadota bacterium]|nr:Ig-like domain-containing protein [Gemmatimonadota bacterium]MDH5760359.1 Ig-like domain-containing protein [Gemmatimonadota bacterium]